MGAPRKSLEPWIPDAVEYYPHQADGIRELSRRSSFLLADDMGLGKSLQALTVFAIDVFRGWATDCIVVAPVTLKGNWQDEIEKFTRFPCVVLDGTPRQREKQLDEFESIEGPKILVVNYEQVVAHLDRLDSIKFDVAIFDEAHTIKNPKAKRTKAALALYSRRSFMLTGTPMLNQVNELWTVLHRIDPKTYSRYWSFVSRYCNTPDAPVWMGDASFKPIGEIVVGDKVMGWERVNGRRSRVVAEVEAVQRRIAPSIIRVTMESGQVIKCTPDHLWLTTSHGGYTQGTVRVNEDTYAPIVKSRGRPMTALSKVIEPTPVLDLDLRRDLDWLNRTKDRIIKVEYIGAGEVVSMQTTSGNYVVWGYASKNCVFGGYKDKQIIGVKNEKELTERLQGVMLRRLKSEVLNLPDVQIIERRVDLHREQRRLYDEVVNEMRLPRSDADDEDIENALTKFLRLKQICGSTFSFTGEDISSKLDLAIEDDLQLLENGEKIVVFTQFRDVQACYSRRLGAYSVPIYQLNGDVKKENRQSIVKEWGATSGASVIVCMIQVAGVGLNMTQARHGSFLDELFVPGLNRQAIDRLHRIGQDESQPVQIRKYITRNTIENRVQQILKTKNKLFGSIVESDPDWKRKLFKAMMEE